MKIDRSASDIAKFNAQVLKGALRAIKNCSAVLALGAVAVYAGPNLFPSNKIREDVFDHRYSHPDERHDNLLMEVCNDMKIDSNQIRLYYNENLTAFMDKTQYDPSSNGILDSPLRLGCIIKLPYQCKFTQNTLRSLKVAGKPVNWESKFGKSFEKSMLLGDKNVKFLMARELIRIKEKHFVAELAVALSFIAGTSSISWLMTSKMLVGGKNIILANMGLVLAGFLTFLYPAIKLKHWLELRADSEACKIGPTYAEGGIESMRTQLKMYRLLRRAFGASAEEVINEKGDHNINVFYPSRLERLERLKQLSKEMYSEESSVFS